MMPTLDMEIVTIDVQHVALERPPGAEFDGSYETCVVVVTADDGTVGVGETDSLASAIRAVVDGPTSHSRARSIRDVLIGLSARDPAAASRALYDATSYIGRRGLVVHALGAVDLALWDLFGKLEGRPVSELIGERHHDRVNVYGTIYPLPRTPDEVRHAMARSVERNLHAHKLCADDWWFDDLALTRSLLRAARETIGDGAPLIVDAALAYDSVEDAFRLLPLLEDVGVWFLEAPLPLDDIEGHERIAARFPIGVGDLGLTHANEFAELIRAGARVCQPDITMVGGITRMLAIAELAREQGCVLIPHGYKTEITIAANLQFLAAQPDPEPMMEYSLSSSPLRWDLIKESFQVEQDGSVIVPNGAGLGITLNEETLNSWLVPGP